MAIRVTDPTDPTDPTDHPPGAGPRFTQMGPAIALGLILLLIPGLPTIAASALTSSADDPEASGPISLESVEGRSITIVPPPGNWRVRDRGNRVAFLSGDASVVIEIVDRGDRDIAAMAERLRRRDRIFGISAAADGGAVDAANGTLVGDSCVLTTEVSTGTCAVVANDEVAVYVKSLGIPGTPALPLNEALASLSEVTS